MDNSAAPRFDVNAIPLHKKVARDGNAAADSLPILLSLGDLALGDVDTKPDVLASPDAPDAPAKPAEPDAPAKTANPDAMDTNLVKTAAPRVLELALVLDDSGSMHGEPMRLLKVATTRILEKGIGGYDRVFVRLFSFHTDAFDLKPAAQKTELVELTEATRGDLIASLDQLTANGAGTNIYDGARAAFEAMVKHNVEKRRVHEGVGFEPLQHVVVFTDGQANRGAHTLGDRVLNALMREFDADTNKIVLSLVGLGTGVVKTFTNQITSKGQAGVFAFAETEQQIGVAFETIFGKILTMRALFDVEWIAFDAEKQFKRCAILCASDDMTAAERREDVILNVKMPRKRLAALRNDEVLIDAIGLTITPLVGECHIKTIDIEVGDEADAPNEAVQKVIESERAEEDIHNTMSSAANIRKLNELADGMEDEPFYRSLIPSKAAKMQRTLEVVRAATQSDSLRDKGAAEASLLFSAISSQNA